MALEIDALRSIATLSLELIDRYTIFGLFRREPRVDLREQQLELLKNLTEANIDPQLFDLLLSAELDRQMKRNF
jgi:hypothetical protein